MSPEHFMSLVTVTPSGCWEWQGYRTASGKLTYTTARGRRVAPRLYAFELLMGRCPYGHLIHKCKNPLCVRPGEGHWEESQASIEAAEPPQLRSEAELTPEEWEALSARWREGSRMNGIRKDLRLTDIAFERALNRIRWAA